jgi:DNA polymerase-3 subunit gamma/tau
MSEFAPDYEGSLDELLSLIHRVAIAQVVPDAIDNHAGDAARVAQIARDITAEDTQLFYQMALNGKRDIALSPDPRRGFEMILLRMLAFRPAAVIDDSLRPEDLQRVDSSVVAGGEASAPAKKPPEVARAPVASRADTSAAHESAADKRPATLERALQTGAGSAATEVPVATKPVAQQKTATAALSLQDLTSDSWWQLLAALGLTGIVYNIASHCELRQREGAQLQFVLDSSHAALFNASHSDKLRLALQNYFGHPVTVSVELGAPSGETPAMRVERLAAIRQAEAVIAIEADPQLQALIARFDGELDRSSIHPTDV